MTRAVAYSASLLLAALVSTLGAAVPTQRSPPSFQLMWNASLPLAHSPNLITTDEMLLVTEDRSGWMTVDALNATTGAQLWTWNSSRWTQGYPPAMVPFLSPQAPGLLFLIQMSGPTMVALDLSTGKVRWNYSSCVGACSYLPVLSTDGTVIFIDDQTRTAVRAISVASGKLLWTFALHSDYGYAATACGHSRAGCLAVLQAVNASATLLFVDGKHGTLLNATVASDTGAYRHGFSFPAAVGSVVTFMMGRSVLGYSAVNYTLLWNRTLAHGFQSVLAYPPGLSGWSTPSAILIAGSSLAMTNAASAEVYWNVSAASTCVDRVPPNFVCGWTPNVFGLLEPHAHALGIFAECTCWNQSAPFDSFSVSRFLALNTSNGALLWSKEGSADPSAILPSADRTVTLLEEGDPHDRLAVYDSKTFQFLQQWTVSDKRSLRFASSHSSLFLLDSANGAFAITAWSRRG